MRTRFAIPILALTCIASVHSTPAIAHDEESEANVSLEKKDGRIVVKLKDELFTEYIFEGYEKPILYPVIGPHEIRMTRDYPMKKGTPNEADDHPHHKSIWFGHMKVNGESFWHVGDSAGTTETTSIRIEGNKIYTANRLVGRDGNLVATDTRVIAFGGDEHERWIDYTVSYLACEGDITFGDNKDGQMGIRMHPAMRIKGPIAVGKAVNAEGVREKEIWGKRAPWIDYWAKIDGHEVGIAVFDHPSNLRHPTWWHARDYGLLSANPFGIHHFEELKNAREGDYTLPKGASLVFRHRFVFHEGNADSAKIGEHYKVWSETPF